MRIFNYKTSITKTLALGLLLTVVFTSRSYAQQGKERTGQAQVQIKVEVFPNPTTQYLTVDLSKLSLDDPKIEIRNIIGSKMTFRSEKLTGDKQRLDVQDYPPGYYLLLVRDDKTKFQQTVRFAKK